MMAAAFGCLGVAFGALLVLVLIPDQHRQHRGWTLALLTVVFVAIGIAGGASLAGLIFDRTTTPTKGEPMDSDEPTIRRDPMAVLAEYFHAIGGGPIAAAARIRRDPESLLDVLVDAGMAERTVNIDTGIRYYKPKPPHEHGPFAVSGIRTDRAQATTVEWCCVGCPELCRWTTDLQLGDPWPPVMQQPVQ
jgi:hypothetical protein